MNMVKNNRLSALTIARQLCNVLAVLFGLSFSLVHGATSVPKSHSNNSNSNLPVSGMVVTTHPLYLIAQAVTQGIEQPKLLLPATQSGHDVQLHPADRQLLKQANFVLWFGAQYEAPLARALKGQSNAIALFELNAFKRLPLRNVQGQPFKGSLDPHLWLDPINASAIAHAIAAVRAQQFPKYASQYKNNASKFTQQLLQQAKLFKMNGGSRAYWAYHDAYQYLERPLNLQFKGSLTVEHDLPPTIGQLAWLKQQRDTQQRRSGQSQPKTMCLLAEGKIDQATLRRLQPIKQQIVDETMRNASSFVSGWTKLAQDIVNCSQV